MTAGDNTPHPDQPGSRGGRLNHFALSVPTRDAFLQIGRRLMDAGQSQRSVRDCGAGWSLKYHDPDGYESELIWTINPQGRLSTPPGTLPNQKYSPAAPAAPARAAQLGLRAQ